jgi:bifunctional DNase/RNase
MIEVRVDGLALDIASNSPVVILKPVQAEGVLPIWIGHYEAWAIAMEMSGFTSRRPLTHDLIRHLVKELEARITRVEVTELKEQTFFAQILLDTHHGRMTVDARPSDSIALALKAKAPIFANEELLQPRAPEGRLSAINDPESLRERLRRINPEDFGNYSL